MSIVLYTLFHWKQNVCTYNSSFFLVPVHPCTLFRREFYVRQIWLHIFFRFFFCICLVYSLVLFTFYLLHLWTNIINDTHAMAVKYEINDEINDTKHPKLGFTNACRCVLTVQSNALSQTCLLMFIFSCVLFTCSVTITKNVENATQMNYSSD